MAQNNTPVAGERMAYVLLMVAEGGLLARIILEVKKVLEGGQLEALTIGLAYLGLAFVMMMVGSLYHHRRRLQLLAEPTASDIIALGAALITGLIIGLFLIG